MQEKFLDYKESRKDLERDGFCLGLIKIEILTLSFAYTGAL